MGTHRVEAGALMDARADVVYGVLADYRDGHPRILPRQLHSLEVTSGSGVGEGTEIRFKAKAPGGDRVFRMAVTEPEPGRVLRETDLDTGTVTNFIVQPAGHRTEVRIVTDLARRPGVAGFLEQFFSRLVLRGMFVEELRLLESVARERVAARATGEA